VSANVRIFRCSKCGKWSHAKKQPKKHTRWVYAGEPEFDESKAEPDHYDHLNGFSEHTRAHAVDCGPFVPYIARPEVS